LTRIASRSVMQPSYSVAARWGACRDLRSIFWAGTARQIACRAGVRSNGSQVGPFGAGDWWANVPGRHL